MGAYPGWGTSFAGSRADIPIPCSRFAKRRRIITLRPAMSYSFGRGGHELGRPNPVKRRTAVIPDLESNI